MLDPDYLLTVADDAANEGSKLEDELAELIIIYLAMLLANDRERTILIHRASQWDTAQTVQRLTEQASKATTVKMVQSFTEQANQIINKAKINMTRRANRSYNQALTRSKTADNVAFDRGIPPASSPPTIPPETISRADGAPAQHIGQGERTEAVPKAKDTRDSQDVLNIEREGQKDINHQIDKVCSDALSSVSSCYLDAVDKAVAAARGGLVSYNDAIKQAILDTAKHGVKIRYPSGHTDSIDVAIARAVRTGISQSCARVTDQKMEEMGWDIVLVSAHLGARIGNGGDNLTNHYWWQGKFYSRSGRDPRFPPFSVCGMGEIQGLHGVNCRHSHGPGDGVHNPYDKFDSADNKRAYDMHQEQRSQERKIRRVAREEMALKAARDAAKDDDQIAARHKAIKKRLASMRKDYKSFCADNGLKPQYDRIKALYS